MAQTLDTYPQLEVSLGRRRVADGAVFFSAKFPGWKARIIRAGGMMDTRLYDYCPAAIAAQGRKGPHGQVLYSHGDVARAYPGEFKSTEMGCSQDGNVSCEVLNLCWKEAAQA